MSCVYLFQIPTEDDDPVEAKGERNKESKPFDTALKEVVRIRENVEKLLKDIESYKGSKETKAYKYLDEMIKQSLIELDTINVGGRDDIRIARKDTVHFIKSCSTKLNKRASGKISDGDNKDSGKLKYRIA